MKLIKIAIKSALLTGALAFATGTALKIFLNKDKILNKLKKAQLKKNNSASTK